MSNPTELPDLDRLEALARAATPGPWKKDSSYTIGPVSDEDDQSYGFVIPLADVYGDNRTPDAAFIAAANPAAVLALIALARRAQPEGEAPQAEPVAWMLDFGDERVVTADRKEMEAWVPQHDNPYTPIPLGPITAPAAQHAESGAPADGDELTDDDKRLVARGMERWRKGIAGECRLPPAGWHCTRAPGHEGPCAATPVAAQSQGAQAVLKEIEAALLRARNPMGDRLTHIDAALNATYAALAAQQAAAPDSLNLMNADEMAALRRFDETCQDGEGYDVPKTMMQRLAAIGVVRRTSGSYYETTEFGLRVLDQPAPSAPGTPEAPDLFSFDELADACVAVEIPDSQYESLCIALTRAAQLDGGQGEGA